MFSTHLNCQSTRFYLLIKYAKKLFYRVEESRQVNAHFNVELFVCHFYRLLLNRNFHSHIKRPENVEETMVLYRTQALV